MPLRFDRSENDIHEVEEPFAQADRLIGHAAQAQPDSSGACAGSRVWCVYLLAELRKHGSVA